MTIEICIYCGQPITDADHEWDCLDARNARDAELDKQSLTYEERENMTEGRIDYGRF